MFRFVIEAIILTSRIHFVVKKNKDDEIQIWISSSQMDIYVFVTFVFWDMHRHIVRIDLMSGALL